MKTMIIVTGMALLMALGANAQGRGRSRGIGGPAPAMPGMSNGRSSATVHSNAPGSIDRDKGRDRAADVGKGHKKGLAKHNKGKR